jgi:hypothetical protein
MRRTHAMKKLVTLLLTAAMVCTMSMSALAAGSPDTGAAEEEVKKQVEDQIKENINTEVNGDTKVEVDETDKVYVDGQEVEGAKVVVSNIEVSADEVTDQASGAAAKIIADDEDLSNDLSNVQVEVWTVDVKVEGVLDTSKGVTVTFVVPGIGSNKENVVIRHQISATGEWESLYPDSVVDDKVTVTFTSFSPVVIVKVSEKEVPAEQPTQPSQSETTTQPTSPATADMMVGTVVVCAAAAMILAVVADKKARNI